MNRASVRHILLLSLNSAVVYITMPLCHTGGIPFPSFGLCLQVHAMMSTNCNACQTLSNVRIKTYQCADLLLSTYTPTRPIPVVVFVTWLSLITSASLVSIMSLGRRIYMKPCSAVCKYFKSSLNITINWWRWRQTVIVGFHPSLTTFGHLFWKRHSTELEYSDLQPTSRKSSSFHYCSQSELHASWKADHGTPCLYRRTAGSLGLESGLFTDQTIHPCLRMDPNGLPAQFGRAFSRVWDATSPHSRHQSR